MTRQEFEDIVADAIEQLPAEFRDQLENLHIEVRDWPTPRDRRLMRSADLLGYFDGVPLTERRVDTPWSLPSRIVVFQAAHEASFRDPQRLRAEVVKTVHHEIGHYFGLDEAEIAAMGLA